MDGARKCFCQRRFGILHHFWAAIDTSGSIKRIYPSSPCRPPEDRGSSTLPPGTSQNLGDRLDQILQGRTFFTLDIDFGRHPSQQLNIPGVGQ